MTTIIALDTADGYVICQKQINIKRGWIRLDPKARSASEREFAQHFQILFDAAQNSQRHVFSALVKETGFSDFEAYRISSKNPHPLDGISLLKIAQSKKLNVCETTAFQESKPKTPISIDALAHAAAQGKSDEELLQLLPGLDVKDTKQNLLDSFLRTSCPKREMTVRRLASKFPSTAKHVYFAMKNHYSDSTCKVLVQRCDMEKETFPEDSLKVASDRYFDAEIIADICLNLESWPENLWSLLFTSPSAYSPTFFSKLLDQKAPPPKSLGNLIGRVDPETILLFVKYGVSLTPEEFKAVLSEGYSEDIVKTLAGSFNEGELTSEMVDIAKAQNYSSGVLAAIRKKRKLLASILPWF